VTDPVNVRGQRTSEFADRFAGIEKIVYQVVAHHEVEGAVWVWQVIDATDIEGD
jgi:hypothetical protein